jgi:uncharacterized protein (TIGR00369 family)
LSTAERRTAPPIRIEPGPWSPDEVREMPRRGFQRTLGIEIVELSQREISARLEVGEPHLNSVGYVHGGVLMALADSLGGMGAVQNLAADQHTATLESKTSFVRRFKGRALHARCVALHVGRRTSIWATTIRSDDGKIVAYVVQTQMHVETSPDATE